MIMLLALSKILHVHLKSFGIALHIKNGLKINLNTFFAPVALGYI